MRTTITIDDDLYQRTKALAAESGRTVGSVVEEALRAALLRTTQVDQRRRELPVHHGGLRPGVNLDDSAALLDLMEGRE